MEQIITSHSERLLMITKELGLSLKKMSKELGYKNANSIYRIDRGEGEITSPLFFLPRQISVVDWLQVLELVCVGLFAFKKFFICHI